MDQRTPVRAASFTSAGDEDRFSSPVEADILQSNAWVRLGMVCLHRPRKSMEKVWGHGCNLRHIFNTTCILFANVSELQSTRVEGNEPVPESGLPDRPPQGMIYTVRWVEVA